MLAAIDRNDGTGDHSGGVTYQKGGETANVLIVTG